jgi:hypothetical protein
LNIVHIYRSVHTVTLVRGDTQDLVVKPPRGMV